MTSIKNIEGDIIWLKCKDCASEYPTFVFSGETDMITSELRVSTDLDSRQLVIYDNSTVSVSGREVELLRVEREHSRPGESFQDFQNRLRVCKPRCFYRCIACADGKASVVRKLSANELLSVGYTLEDLRVV